MRGGSYWIPGSYASMLSKNRHSFLSPLKNKGFKEEIMTKIGFYDILKPTTPESNKSLDVNAGRFLRMPMPCRPVERDLQAVTG